MEQIITRPEYVTDSSPQYALSSHIQEYQRSRDLGLVDLRQDSQHGHNEHEMHGHDNVHEQNKPFRHLAMVAAMGKFATAVAGGVAYATDRVAGQLGELTHGLGDTFENLKEVRLLGRKAEQRTAQELRQSRRRLYTFITATSIAAVGHMGYEATIERPGMPGAFTVGAAAVSLAFNVGLLGMAERGYNVHACGHDHAQGHHEADEHIHHPSHTKSCTEIEYKDGHDHEKQHEMSLVRDGVVRHLGLDAVAAATGLFGVGIQVAAHKMGMPWLRRVDTAAGMSVALATAYAFWPSKLNLDGARESVWHTFEMVRQRLTATKRKLGTAALAGVMLAGTGAAWQAVSAQDHGPKPCGAAAQAQAGSMELPQVILPPQPPASILLNVQPGDGWYDVFERYNVPQNQWGQLLAAITPGSTDQGVAYKDSQHGDVRITHPGQLPSWTEQLITSYSSQG